MTVDNSHQSTNPAFAATRQLINSPGLVTVTLVSPNAPLPLGGATQDASGVAGPTGAPTPGTETLANMGLAGITLPSPGTAAEDSSRPEPGFSLTPGETQVFLSNALSPRDLARTLLHEILEHAHPAVVQGTGANRGPAHFATAPLVQANVP